MDFITIDFETATAQRNSAVEVGLTFVQNNKICDTFSWLIKPPYDKFDHINMQIHGIRPEDVKDSPTFAELWPTIEPLIQNKFLLAHNASFDMSVLRSTLDYYLQSYPEVDYSCTYKFAKNTWPELPTYNLQHVCKINDIHFSHHRASEDSIAAARLALKIFELKEITNKSQILDKLNTSIGKLFKTSYYPSSSKSNYNEFYNKKDGVIGDQSKNNPDSIFYNKKVVFTGTLISMERRVAFQKIADLGGILCSGVTKETDYLIVGQQDYRLVGDDGMSNKQEKAIKLKSIGSKIEILSESEFLENI